MLDVQADLHLERCLNVVELSCDIECYAQGPHLVTVWGDSKQQLVSTTENRLRVYRVVPTVLGSTEYSSARWPFP